MDAVLLSVRRAGPRADHVAGVVWELPLAGPCAEGARRCPGRCCPVTRRPVTRRAQPQKAFWALYDQNGELFQFGYDSYDEADNDAVGPRFRRGHTVREYRLVLRKSEAPRPRRVADD